MQNGILSDENYCQISNKQFKLGKSKDCDLIPIEKPVVSNTPVDMVPDYSEEVVVRELSYKKTPRIRMSSNLQKK